MIKVDHLRQKIQLKVRNRFIICGAETVDENGDSRCEIHRKGTSITAEVAQQYADKFSRLTALASSITRFVEDDYL